MMIVGLMSNRRTIVAILRPSAVQNALESIYPVAQRLQVVRGERERIPRTLDAKHMQAGPIGQVVVQFERGQIDDSTRLLLIVVVRVEIEQLVLQNQVVLSPFRLLSRLLLVGRERKVWTRLLAGRSAGLQFLSQIPEPTFVVAVVSQLVAVQIFYHWVGVGVEDEIRSDETIGRDWTRLLEKIGGGSFWRASSDEIIGRDHRTRSLDEDCQQLASR